jgi:Cu2+-exporting ATPase
MPHAGHDKHAGHDPETFRRRFWLTLLISLPVVATSEMIMDWFGYSALRVAWVGPVLGHVRVPLGRLAVPQGQPPTKSATGHPG